MYLPCAQDGVQSLTFKTPLPKATGRQLVHVRPVTSSLEGMQLGSYPAGRTWPWPLQLTSTTWLDSADAGPAARTTPASAAAVEQVRFAAPGLADTGAIAHPQTASRELVSVAGWRICPHVTVTVG